MRRRDFARNLALGLIAPGLPFVRPAQAAGQADSESDREVVIRGRAVCLRSGEPTAPDECSFGDPFAIRSEDGELHRLDPADPRVEILTEPRVNAHELEIVAWREDGLAKIIHLHAIQDGERIEPYYFCFTCNITAHIPGPCWCCQQEFEFKERPARIPAPGR